MVRSHGKRLLAAVMLAALMVTVGTAQEGTERRGANSQARPTLVLALRTSSSLTEKNIRATLKVIRDEYIAEGKEKLTWEDVVVIPSTREGFEQVELIVQGDGKTESVTPVVESGDIGLQLPKKGVFAINCGDPRNSLESMTLNYGENKTANFIVDPNQKDNPLEYIRTHRTYYFKHDSEKYPNPKEYKLKVITKEATKTKSAEYTETKSLPWPQERNRFWVVKLVGWSGDLDDLRKRLNDPEVLGNPFDISGAKFTTFGIGAVLQETPDEPSEGFNKDYTRFQFIVPLGKREGRVAKVWMRFPLTKAEADAESAKLNDKTFLEIPEEIEKLKDSIRLDDVKTVAVKSPVWIEMSKMPGQFERSVTIENPNIWKKEQDGPVYRVVVYVMQPPGKAAQALKMTSDGKEVYGLVKEVKAWQLHRDVLKSEPKEKIEKIAPK